MLDVIQVTVAPPAMRSFQTENMQIENYEWHKVEPSPPGEDLLQWLDSTINDTMAWLFGFEGDYLDKEVTDRWKDPETLKLVHPKNIVWKVTTGPTGRRRCQATFTIGKLSSDDKPYTLVVTDPNVEQLLTRHPHGKYQESDIKVQDNVGYYWNAPGENLVFTVSLGEPHSEDGRCYKSYKLVAGVTTLPSSRPTRSDAPEDPPLDLCEALRFHGIPFHDLRWKGERHSLGSGRPRTWRSFTNPWGTGLVRIRSSRRPGHSISTGLVPNLALLRGARFRSERTPGKAAEYIPRLGDDGNDPPYVPEQSRHAPSMSERLRTSPTFRLLITSK